MTNLPRRKFLRLAAGLPAGLIAAKALSGCSSEEGTAESDSSTSGSTEAVPSYGPVSTAPIRLGFIALTDCASIVMAQELGYFKERGLNVEVIKQVLLAGHP